MVMKKSHLLLYLTISLSVLSSQAKEPSDPQITQFQKWHEEIQKDKALKTTLFSSGKEQLPVVTKLSRSESAAGALRKFELSEQRSRTRKDTTYASDIKTTYFFHQGELFLVIQQDEKSRTRTKDGKPATDQRAGVYHYYFNKGKCILAMSKSVEAAGSADIAKLLAAKKLEKNDSTEGTDIYLEISKELAAIQSQKDFSKYFNPEQGE